MCRKSNVVGTSTSFQKIGKGAATTKARHGVIPPMNQDHTAIPCTMEDFYAGDWVDKLDEAKINHDERQAIALGGARALGRKVDDQIIVRLDATGQSVVSWVVTSSAGIRNSLLQMVEALDNNDVPNDGQRYGLLTPRAWSQAMTVEEFQSYLTKFQDMSFSAIFRQFGSVLGEVFLAVFLGGLLVGGLLACLSYPLTRNAVTSFQAFRAKKKEMSHRVKARGISDEQLERVEWPVGLDIGAVSPAEIAVSILGSIIQDVRKREEIPVLAVPDRGDDGFEE